MFFCLLLDGLSLAGIFLFAITARTQEREGQGKLVRLTAISSLERGSIHTYMYIFDSWPLARPIDEISLCEDVDICMEKKRRCKMFS